MRFRNFRFLSYLFCLSACLLAGGLSAAGPSISAISGSSPVTRYNKWEVTFSLGTVYPNPYDPAQIDAKVVFSGPGGISFTAVAFPYQAYTRSGNLTTQTLTPSGGLLWKARIAPTLTGAWTSSISATDGTGSSSAVGPAATVQPSAKPGFVRISSSDSRYFAHDDGSLYVPQGENIAWAGGGRTYQYDQWFSGLAAGGGNFARVWMAAWGMSVDWDFGHSNTYLGNYANRQGESWELDHVLDQADADGIKVMLCLIHHGMFSSTTNPNWVDNIYSSAWGGPLTAPELVWTNAAAKALIKRRLRYILARWSYSTSVQSWELWNEMEWTDNFNVNVANAAAWHQEMGDYLKANDPHRHLVSTSLADGAAWGTSIWNAGMEFVQTHYYGATDWAQYASDTTASFLAAHAGKPFHLGEWGMTDDPTSVSQDPSGMSIGETAWASVMSKAASGGAPWWWDGWVPNQNLYWRWKGISAFTAGEDLDQRAYVPVRPAVSTATRADVNISPSFNNGAPWGSPSPASNFAVNANGSLTPGADQLGRYLWGSWTAGKNPPTFAVVYGTAGQFKVQVQSASGSGSTNLTVTLDGVLTALNNTPVTAGSTYSIAVPAGVHSIFVDGTGQDWIVPVYTFTNYTGILRCFALTGTAKALGWVQSRNYTFYNQCASCQGGSAKALPSIGDGAVQLTGLSNDGTWNVSWFETVSGTVQSSTTALASGGAMSLSVPAMAKDLAFKLAWAGPASTPTFTPTRSSTRTPSSTPTRTPTPSPSATATRTPVSGTWNSVFVPPNGSGGWDRPVVNVGGTNFRMPDFSYSGYKLSEKGLGDGIPCTSISITAIAGEDISPKLNQAVTTLAAVGGGTIYIPAGAYTLGSRVTINADNVVIKGAGSGATNLTATAAMAAPGSSLYEGIFYFTGNASNIAQWILSAGALTSTSASADIPQNAVSVQALNASIFGVGDWVVVQQFFTPAFIAATSASTWLIPPFASQAAREFSFTYVRKVTSVGGGIIGVDAPIPRPLALADGTITIYKPKTADYSENVGLEGLSLYTEARGVAEWNGVMWKGVFNGWARDVKLTNFNLHGFQPQWAARITILDCATDLAQYIGGGGQGYSYHVNASQAVLVRRCSSTNVRHNITTQKPMCSDVVFSRMDDSNSTQQDDTHHSYAHNVLWDMVYQHGGVGISATNRGTTSTNAYETFAGGAVWNHHGDGVTTGGWQAGKIQIRPDNYMPANQGFVIGNWGGHRVYDNSTDINSSYVNGPEITGAAPQVGPRGNVAYEGVSVTGLSPASLFEGQLATRLGGLPPELAAPACGSTPTPTATPTAAVSSPTRTPTATASPTPTRTASASSTPTATASPSASRTSTGTASSSPTVSPVPSATSTRSPTASPTRSATSTPTPAGAWAAEKQLDAFKATAQFYTGFQPGGAGSNLTLSVATAPADVTEGAESVQADIVFSFGPMNGIAELLRGYGTQTLDLSLQPYGLSVWAKAFFPGDQLRLMVYEDHDMDGDPYEAGDEVWASPVQTIGTTWTRLVFPWAAFSVYAGAGNGALELNRVYAWRLAVVNGDSSAHGQTVWFDDLRQLTTRTPAPDNSAVLSGSFIQLWNAGAGCNCGGWTQPQWDAELQKLKDLCQDTVYVQYGAWEDNAWYAPEGQSFLNFSNPTLGRIFQSAQTLGMKVVVGLWFGESWNTDNKALAATYSTPLSRSTAVAGEIAALYGSSPAFGGWYIPQEVNDLEWPTGSPQLTLLRNYLRDVAAAAKAAKNAPVYLAPFFGPNRPADDLQAWWDGTLAVATGIDVLIPQDGVGTTRVDGDVDVPHYLAAIQAAALGRGRSFGATIESFAQTDGWPINGNAFAAVPAPIAQLKSQLWEAKAAGASTLVQFEYPYMQASRGAAYAQLYADYQAYQSLAAPCAYSPTPTVTPSASPSRTPTPTGTPSATASRTPSFTPGASATASPTPSASSTPTATPSRSPSASPTATLSASPAASASATRSSTPASTPTVSPTPGGPSFSGHLLYSLLSGGHYRLAGLDLSTGVLSPLTSPGTADDMNPMVSPDQRYAVFYSNRDGDQEIWRLDLLSFAVTQLTSNTASDYDPAYSPDGSKIVFKSNRDDGLGDIFVMNADGSGQVNLTAGRSGTEDWDPVFSQDGSKIYFVSRLTAGDPNSDEIFVMNADGSNVVRLTNNSVPDWYPAVNPLDGRVAFVSKSGPASDDDLFVMNADGSGRLQLTTGNGDEGDPAWSPEATRLAFVRWNGSAYETYLANADGSGAALAPPQSGQQLGPCWWQPLPVTPTPSATASSSPSATATATRSFTATASPSLTPSATATRTPSSTPAASASPTRTPAPSATATWTPVPATPTFTPLPASPSPTFSPTPAVGTLEVLEAWPVPNPDPVELRFKLAGPAEQVTLKLWTPAMVCVIKLSGGPYAGGWQSLALPAQAMSTIPLGLLYYTVEAQQGSRRSPERAPGRLVRLR